MLNQSFQRHFQVPTNISRELSRSDWCVGDAPVQWDVSFADRLIATVRRLFTRAHVPPPLKMPVTRGAANRKAA